MHWICVAPRHQADHTFRLTTDRSALAVLFNLESMKASTESRLNHLMDQLVLLSSIRERDALLRQLTQSLSGSIDAEVVDVFGLVTGQ